MYKSVTLSIRLIQIFLVLCAFVKKFFQVFEAWWAIPPSKCFGVYSTCLGVSESFLKVQS